MSDDVPEWALREAREVTLAWMRPLGMPAYSRMNDEWVRHFARALTAAEQQGHERGVREERERAERACRAMADSGLPAKAASGCIAAANAVASGIDPGTPGDTEGT